MIRHNYVQNIVEQLGEHTLSLYLHVDSGYIKNQATTPAWQIYLKNALSNAKQMENDSVDRASTQRVFPILYSIRSCISNVR